MSLFVSIRRLALGISTSETTFSHRGFSTSNRAVQQHLEAAGRQFVDGYHAALAKPQADRLAAGLNDVSVMYRGFAYEGAAMALALLDYLTPWNRGRLQALIDSPAGDAHRYMLHVGVGWAIARIPWARR